MKYNNIQENKVIVLRYSSGNLTLENNARLADTMFRDEAIDRAIEYSFTQLFAEIGKEIAKNRGSAECYFKFVTDLSKEETFAEDVFLTHIRVTAYELSKVDSYCWPTMPTLCK